MFEIAARPINDPEAALFRSAFEEPDVHPVATLLSGLRFDEIARVGDACTIAVARILCRVGAGDPDRPVTDTVRWLTEVADHVSNDPNLTRDIRHVLEHVVSDRSPAVSLPRGTEHDEIVTLIATVAQTFLLLVVVIGKACDVDAATSLRWILGDEPWPAVDVVTWDHPLI